MVPGAKAHVENQEPALCDFSGVHGRAGGLLFGFDLAIITGAGPFLTRHFALSDIGLGWAFSSLLFGQRRRYLTHIDDVDAVMNVVR